MATRGQPSDQGAPAQPSKAQLALALIVIRTKEYDWSLESHIKSLRYNGYVWGAGVAPEADFWKKSFDQSQVDNAVLRQQITELPNTLSLVPSTELPKTFDTLGEPLHPEPAVKRKYTEELQATAQAKRRKLPNAATKTFVNAALPKTFPQPNEDVPEEVKNLIQSSTFLDQHARLGYDCGGMLATHVRELTGVITKECGKVLVGGKHANLVKKGSVEVLVGLAGRFDALYLTVLRVVESAAVPEDIDGVTFGVVNCVRLLESLLDGLYTVARLDFDRRAHEFAKSKDGDSEEFRRDLAKGIYHEPRHYMDKYKYHDKLEALAKMLYSVFASLQLTQPRDAILLESLLCALLNHVGRALAKIVFADRCQTAGVPNDKKLLEKAVSDAPQPLKDDFKRCDQSWISIETAVARSQAKYLVVALKLAMAKVEALNVTPDGRLVPFMADKIQNTLLRGLFGDDEAFGNCLKQIALGGKEVEEALGMVCSPFMAGDGEECDAWFIGKVWEIVGWDILSHKVNYGYAAREMRMAPPIYVNGC